MVAERLAGWRRWLLPVISAVLVTALIAALLRPGRSGIAGSPLLDKPAPASTLRSLDGVKVELASLQGRPVVVNFWASWCLPCRDEAPLLRSLSETQSDRGLAVLGISFQEPELQNARAFIREYALAYPSLIDPGARTAINYGVSGVPETFFIDRQGIVRSADRGGLTPARLSEGLSRIGIKWP